MVPEGKKPLCQTTTKKLDETDTEKESSDSDGGGGEGSLLRDFATEPYDANRFYKLEYPPTHKS